MNHNLILMRNFLFKWFIIGFALFFVSAISFIFLKDFGAEMAFRFYNVAPVHYYNTAVTLLGLLKIALFFFVLTPALALHWVIKSQEIK